MSMMGMCKKCTKISALLLLVLGVLFLLVDLGMWSFFNIQWWTALFLLMGVIKLAHTYCPECNAVPGKKK
jgi:membrane-bound ClpP family serine protease